MSEPTKSPKTPKEQYIAWLEERILETEEEKEAASEDNLKINKGGKLRAYKDVLHYIKEH